MNKQSFRAVQVEFADNLAIKDAQSITAFRSYTYMADEGYVVGDIVVVETKQSYSVARIVSIGSVSDTTGLKWVVCKVDVTAAEAAKAKMLKIAEIRQKMFERKAELEESAVWSLLAKEDSTMAALVEELNL